MQKECERVITSLAAHLTLERILIAVILHVQTVHNLVAEEDAAVLAGRLVLEPVPGAVVITVNSTVGGHRYKSRHGGVTTALLLGICMTLDFVRLALAAAGLAGAGGQGRAG